LLTLIGGPRMSPFWAAIAMALSSVSVVLNSLRLRSHGVPPRGDGEVSQWLSPTI